MTGSARVILFARSMLFVDALELRGLGFDDVDAAGTGRPAYHPWPMLKLYIYGYARSGELRRLLTCFNRRPDQTDSAGAAR